MSTELNKKLLAVIDKSIFHSPYDTNEIANALYLLVEDVAVKFAEWKANLKPLIPSNFDILMSVTDGKIKARNTKDLFTYFINNIYGKQ